MVRGFFRRRPCHLAHARPGKWLLRRLEISRADGNGLPAGSRTVGRNWRACRRRPKTHYSKVLARSALIAEAWQDYLSLHLAALSGWAGFIKWRADQNEYEWQTAYPIDLAQYLAVRLWYERELVHKRLPQSAGDRRQRRRHCSRDAKTRRALCSRPPATTEPSTASSHRRLALVAARARAGVGTGAADTDTGIEPARCCSIGCDGFPESAHGPVWLKAFEAGYQEQLLEKLAAQARSIQ